MKALVFLCFVIPAFSYGVQQRIIGGSFTDIVKYPYLLSIRENGGHTCGASLIGTDRAVTVAHCAGSSIGTYSILGGTTDRTDIACESCVLRNLDLISRHPDHDDTLAGRPNDVAVLGFTPVVYSTYLLPVDLSTIEDGDYAGATCRIAGWGMDSPDSNYQFLLQEGTMVVTTNVECSNNWGLITINDGHVCAMNPDVTTCTGDDGGPLECLDKLAGAFSWSAEFCSPAYPAVFTRISFFYSWILSQ